MFPITQEQLLNLLSKVGNLLLNHPGSLQQLITDLEAIKTDVVKLIDDAKAALG